MEKLIFQPGLSGYETQVRDFILEEIKDYAPAKIDSIGNLTASAGSGHPRIIFTSHMDEIGMVVSHIEPNGFIKMRKVGLLDDRLLIGRAVEFITKKGKIPGVIGIRPPHLMTNLEDFERLRYVPSWDEVVIDVGTSSKDETEELGIKVMDPIIFKKDFMVLNKTRCVARGLDDRFGCALLVKILEKVSKTEVDKKITFAWTVQEEIGAIGGRALSVKDQWDIMFAVDSYSSADIPDVPFHYGPAKIGKGPVVRLMDHRSVSTPKLAQWVIELARKENIPLQVGPTGGYTDGQHFLSRGIPMVMLSVPVRYMHSPVEMIDMRDLEGLLNLVFTIINADKEELSSFTR